jgi:hypothetical protein
LLEDIVDKRICDIDSFYNELEDEIDVKLKDILDNFMKKIESDPEYIDLKKKDIKLIIYQTS